MRYEILGDDGKVVSAIVADRSFMTANYPDGKWREVVEPTSPPVPQAVPSQVTMRQARRALHAFGKLQLVQAAINSLSEPPKTEALIDWEYSSVVQRHNGFVTKLAPALGMSPTDIDALFVAAAAYQDA